MIYSGNPADLPAFRLAMMRAAPRCLARKRDGSLCQKPAIKGKPRCQIHGCAKGAGAPKGEKNGAWKTGDWTNEAVAFRQEVARVLRRCRDGVHENA